MAIPSPWDRVGRRVGWSRKYLTRRDWALLEDAFKAAGIPWSTSRVVQGSWSGGRRSAGTHTGAGAFDLSVRGLSLAQILRLVWELRKRNVAAYYRAPGYGWNQPKNKHIHGIVKDTPGLSYGAQRQVINYNNGQNALAGRGKDPHRRPTQTKFRIPGMAPAPKITADTEVRLANLRYGQQNADVKDLQRALKITTDGHYGPVTDAAVRAHQKRMGLTPDRKGHSYIGPRQARALGLSII
jgi:Putative peptidoglycan binding domain